MDEMKNMMDDTEEESLKNRFLTFRIDAETYGIEIRYVMEIIGIQAITEMPELPDYIKGIINLRGSIIPVMDVRVRFGRASAEYNDRTCVIVIDYYGKPIGFIVDSVADVMQLPESEILDRPQANGAEGTGYVNKIGRAGECVILLLDCGKMLST